MSHRFEITERVQFSETDMAGIVHFSNFYRYMERAEHGFFRSLGLSVIDPAHHGHERVGWPRVHASCEFFLPLFFEDEVRIELLVEEVRSKVIRYLFRFWRMDGELAAEGRVTAASVRKDAATGKMKAVSIPDRIRHKVEAAPASLLAAVRPKGPPNNSLQ
ncbi:MAG: 4-hydroxybenzoyl-CoA thioesterase [Verrucomicrobiaceae bacterium]|nr:4-hydroxybenzoyl-CoA thioesterase [Verrucomicrobiaceae bacterium]